MPMYLCVWCEEVYKDTELLIKDDKVWCPKCKDGRGLTTWQRQETQARLVFAAVIIVGLLIVWLT